MQSVLSHDRGRTTSRDPNARAGVGVPVFAGEEPIAILLVGAET